MLDNYVTVMGVGRQMGLKFAPLLFGKVSSAHRPMTVQPQLSSVRQTLALFHFCTANIVNFLQ